MAEQEAKAAASEQGREEAELPPLRFGVLGASWIAPMAVIEPAEYLPNHAVMAAVAARDRTRAEAYAKKHKIATVYDSYEELIASADLDCVYVPLPNSHHREWAIKAMRAGKHVLCEKPLACSVAEAEEMLAVAAECNVLLLEAFHYRFHPAARRLEELVSDSERMGEIQSVHTNFSIPVFSSSDIRYQLHLGGGACMDTGCYALNALRLVSGASLGEPRVSAATAVTSSENVDQSMRVELGWEGKEAKGVMECSIFKIVPNCFVEVVGSKCSVYLRNFVVPHVYHKIFITERDPESGRNIRSESENVNGMFDLKHSTYYYQLRAFVDAVRAGITLNSSDEDVLAVLPFHPRDSVHTMRLIEQVYDAAGLCPRDQSSAASSASSSAGDSSTSPAADEPASS